MVAASFDILIFAKVQISITLKTKANAHKLEDAKSTQTFHHTVCIDDLTCHINIKSLDLYNLLQFILIKSHEILLFQTNISKILRSVQP